MENAAPLGIVFDPDGAAMRFDNGTADRQTEAHALAGNLFTLFHLMELLKDLLLVQVWYAGAEIRNRQEKTSLPVCEE